jgi:D-xylono/L-arabinono-1,4-lactonase
MEHTGFGGCRWPRRYIREGSNVDNPKLCEGPELIADYACTVGENPTWHPAQQQLLWTDIPAGRLYSYDSKLRRHEAFYEGRPVGGLTIQEDGALLLFKDRGTITCWQDRHEVTLIPEIPEERELGFNDVIADPSGRVFCGTYADGRLGRLYRLDTDGSLTKLLDGIGCSNGMAFTLDRTGFFYTDSVARAIYKFDYEEADGSIRNQKIFYEVPEDDGLPDGCTVDSEGYLWFALWGGSRIVRLHPEGRVSASVGIPAKRTTSLTFAGPDLRDIYVTSEGGEWRTDDDPLAGALFRTRCRIAGRPEYFSRIALPGQVH